MSELERESSGSDKTATIRIDMNAGFSHSTEDSSVPISMKTLGMEATDIISSLTHKPAEKYQFRGSLGRGGMKLVIQVQDKDTNRDIAMALLPDAANRPMSETLRFIEEARITASLEHPNIVPVHDIGVDNSGSPYFTMKLLRGETFASVLKKVFKGAPGYVEKYTLENLLRIYLKLCNAVAFAHSRGVLHLDLKPENVQIGDYGEVLLMDWGLAHVISGPDMEPTRTLDSTSSVTQNGVTKGTPGYMAPEQAAGLNNEKDFRTDVYALGAILYTILTGRNPLDLSRSLAQLMNDTIAGNVVPPHERVPERAIPQALEAVVLKAMSVRPANRYPSAEALRDEITAFLGGFATKAERATPIKKAALFLKRHLVVSGASVLIAVILLGLGLFLLHDRSLQRGDWIPVYEKTFSDSQNESPEFSFYNRTISSPVPPWRVTPEGLRLVRDEWLWFSNISPNLNVKVELKLKTTSAGGGILICVNSSMDTLKYPWNNPVGYSAQIAGHSGAVDLICRNETPSSQEMIASSASRFKKDAWNTISFEHSNSGFRLTVNGYSVKADDLFPINKKNPGWIGLRTNGSSVLLKSVSVYRLALPEKASPLIAGDTLVEFHLYREAIEKYLTAAENYGKGPIAEQALIKAYHTAVTYISDKDLRISLTAAIRKTIDTLFPNKYRYQEVILEFDALQFWKDGKYHLALDLTEEIFKLNPRSNIIPKILQFPHKKLPEDVLFHLIRGIRRTNGLKRLNVSSLGITNLNDFSGLDLVYLDCSGNGLKSLAGIEKMPLEVLVCRNNRIKDLAPLKNIPLKMLDCGGNQLTSLESLEIKNIQSVIANQNKIVSVSSLKNAPQLEVLELGHNQITEISPLENLPVLRKLDLSNNPVSDISVVSTLPLETLMLNYTDVSDLSPMVNLSLTTLELGGCEKVKDLTPLRSLTMLETLVLPPNAENRDVIREIPALQYIYGNQEGQYR